LLPTDRAASVTARLSAHATLLTREAIASPIERSYDQSAFSERVQIGEVGYCACAEGAGQPWQPSIGTLHALADVDPDETMDAATVAWFALGPARPHYTLAYGEIISKARGAEYLGQLFPECAQLAYRAIRWHAGEAERFNAADLAAAGDSVNAVADNAWRRFGS
jgi:hypothetical protein